jgi:hypothetical protein
VLGDASSEYGNSVATVPRQTPSSSLLAEAQGEVHPPTTNVSSPPPSPPHTHTQVAHSPYRGVIDCVQKVLAQEGVGALFKSYR